MPQASYHSRPDAGTPFRVRMSTKTCKKQKVIWNSGPLHTPEWRKALWEWNFTLDKTTYITLENASRMNLNAQKTSMDVKSEGLHL